MHEVFVFGACGRLHRKDLLSQKMQSAASSARRVPGDALRAALLQYRHGSLFGSSVTIPGGKLKHLTLG